MPTPKQVKILLVEDDPGDQKLIRYSLESQKIASEIIFRDTGEEALSYLDSCKKSGPNNNPDLILLDLNMPGIGGVEFLKTIKKDEDFRTIPVVILTTSNSAKDIAKSYKLQAAGYIVKPHEIVQFHEALRQVGNYWFLVCKLPHKE